jgi:hypothetical protein
LRNSSTLSKLHYQSELIDWIYDLAFLTLGTDPAAPIENAAVCVPNAGKERFLDTAGNCTAIAQ